jgi:ATP phosphoribosyltransferase regulatory subunit
MTTLEYPDGIRPISGERALNIIKIQNNFIECFTKKGYEFVIFPLADFLDSLLISRDDWLETQTCTTTDRVSGKNLGIRADITPQALKLDLCKNPTSKNINKFCYCDTTLQSKPTNNNRQFIQAGAEIFGIDSIHGDLEILDLMLTSLKNIGITELTIDFGHIGLYKVLAKTLKLNTENTNKIFDILQQKRSTELDEMLQNLDLTSEQKKLITNLSSIYGNGEGVVEELKTTLNASKNNITSELQFVIDDLKDSYDFVADFATKNKMKINIHIDICELRGHKYKTGLVFAIYHKSHSHHIAVGGRYDDAGKKGRSATGFSCDLELISQIIEAE